jgi:hypothetical protein
MTAILNFRLYRANKQLPVRSPAKGSLRIARNTTILSPKFSAAATKRLAFGDLNICLDDWRPQSYAKNMMLVCLRAGLRFPSTA